MDMETRELGMMGIFWKPKGGGNDFKEIWGFFLVITAFHCIKKILGRWSCCK